MTAIFATSGLNATVFYSEKVNIPFEFKAGKHWFGAGEYRVEQDFGKDIAYLVNIKTGQRVQMMRPMNGGFPAHSKLVFENSDGVRVLRKIS